MSRTGSRDGPGARGEPPRRLLAAWRHVGPGLVLAATGVGAGDLIAAAVAGSRYGYALIWAAVLGALLKFVLSEGLARWQLATGTTLLEGWAASLSRGVQVLLLAYLVIWSLVVGAALISACGIAAHALVPALAVWQWGTLHSLLAAAVVLVGGYRSFEGLVRVFVGLMAVTLIGCALWVDSPAATVATAVREAGLPGGAVAFVLSVIGGVGGSVTLLSYGYWMREKGWDGARWLGVVRVDLAAAYVLTGAFAVAVMVLSARMLHGSGVAVEGRQAVLRMAEMLEPLLGRVGRWTFLVGFWGAVASSMLGVWQGVPYLFCDFVGLLRRLPEPRRRALIDPRSWGYRAFLAWLCLPPLLFLRYERPVVVIVAYSVLGALFLPCVAATLIRLNRRPELGALRSGPLGLAGLLLCLALFAYLAIHDLLQLL